MNSTTARPDPRSAEAVRKALEQFPIAVQDKLVRSAMRPFMNAEMRKIRALNATRLPTKDLKGKIRIYKGIAWGAVAYKVGRANTGGTGGRARRAAYDAAGTGWRSHFAELGTHAWSATLRRPPTARGLGWKRGLYHRGRGKYIRGTHASQLVHAAMAPQFSKLLADQLSLLIQSKRTLVGNRTLRTVEEFS